MDELRACPFCGAEAAVGKNYNSFTEWYLCFCPKCHVSQTGNNYGSNVLLQKLFRTGA